MNDTPRNYLAQLKTLVKKLQAEPEFMASLLANYQREEHLNDDELIAQFDITQNMFIRLALCKRPNSSSPTFASEVKQISEYTNIDPFLLVNMIRQVESIESLSKHTNIVSKIADSARKRADGLLAAARDKTDDSDSKASKSDQDIQEDKGEDDVAG